MFPFLDAAARFGAACDAAGVPYFLGGSAATTLHGEPRMTNDLDFVVDAPVGRVPALVAALGADFEADVDALSRAARLRASWNLFFLPDFTKIDVFFLKAQPYDRVEFDRRQGHVLPDGRRLWVKSPEDSVLRKLCWFRDGGGVSERQWRDVVMTLRLNGGRLDDTHLDTWAGVLGVAHLLEKARAAAG
jgi:hypothetical protein